MKKYLLLVENEELWAKFKETIDNDINSEIMELIKEKIKKSRQGFSEENRRSKK
ncbi:MAG: hypothetical protein AABX83_04180 [Nanoarchaeota archaeon]